LTISRNHTLTRPAQLFFFGVCAPVRFHGSNRSGVLK